MAHEEAVVRFLTEWWWSSFVYLLCALDHTSSATTLITNWLDPFCHQIIRAYMILSSHSYWWLIVWRTSAILDGHRERIVIYSCCWVCDGENITFWRKIWKYWSDTFRKKPEPDLRRIAATRPGRLRGIIENLFLNLYLTIPFTKI